MGLGQNQTTRLMYGCPMDVETALPHVTAWQAGIAHGS